MRLSDTATPKRNILSSKIPVCKMSPASSYRDKANFQAVVNCRIYSFYYTEIFSTVNSSFLSFFLFFLQKRKEKKKDIHSFDRGSQADSWGEGCRSEL
jgi:hypothetical protein